MLFSFALLSFSLSNWATSPGYSLQVTNNTDLKVSMGTFKDIYLPSWCEDGPCLESVYEYLSPVSRKVRSIKGTKLQDITKIMENEKSVFVVIKDDGNFYKQVEFISCELARESNPYYPVAESPLRITLDSRLSYCLNLGTTRVSIGL